MNYDETIEAGMQALRRTTWKYDEYLERGRKIVVAILSATNHWKLQESIKELETAREERDQLLHLVGKSQDARLGILHTENQRVAEQRDDARALADQAAVLISMIDSYVNSDDEDAQTEIDMWNAAYEERGWK